MSSIFTFLMGIFSVLIVRALASLCCRKVAFRIIVVNGDVFFYVFKKKKNIEHDEEKEKKEKSNCGEVGSR